MGANHLYVESIPFTTNPTEQTHFLKTLFDLTPDIIIIYDLMSHTNSFSNKGFKEMLGYSDSEIQEMGDQLFSFLLHPDDLETFQKKIIPQYITALNTLNE